MNSSPKIIVLKMREIIYTIVLLFLAVLLILCLVLMFSRKETENQPNRFSQETQPDTASADASGSSDTSAVQSAHTSAVSSDQLYVPGIYSTRITLGESAVDVEVTVDGSQIKDIRLVNLSETAAASYPLVSSSLTNIASQILETQSLEEITCPQENRYTSQLLLAAISDALAKAEPSLWVY